MTIRVGVYVNASTAREAYSKTIEVLEVKVTFIV